MKIKLCAEDCEHTPEIFPEKLVQRLVSHFPTMEVDWEKGNAHVQEGLDRLIALNAPEVILMSHRSHFGKVVFVSIRESHWCGVTATSYLHRIWPPLGDAVVFETKGEINELSVDLVAQELAEALRMAVWSEHRQIG